jgi:hypothetical protein
MKILICGVGAIGSNLVKNLVSDLKGEHEITILDKDVVEERNVTPGTQFYTIDQVGLPKVEALQFNIFKWFEREIDIVNEPFDQHHLIHNHYDLVVDCFDNYDARNHVQNYWSTRGMLRWGSPFELLHVGFSDQFTFAIEWADNYTVPTDITSGVDICEMAGASAFVSHVSSLGALVAEKFIQEKEKEEIIGGKLYAKKI